MLTVDSQPTVLLLLLGNQYFICCSLTLSSIVPGIQSFMCCSLSPPLCSNEQVKKEMSGWGLKFADNLINIQARILPPEVIIQANDKKVSTTLYRLSPIYLCCLLLLLLGTQFQPHQHPGSHSTSGGHHTGQRQKGEYHLLQLILNIPLLLPKKLLHFGGKGIGGGGGWLTIIRERKIIFILSRTYLCCCPKKFLPFGG